MKLKIKEPEPETLEGILHFFSEPGTEGGYWAFQDKRFITPNTTYFACTKCGTVWNKEKYPESTHSTLRDQCLPDDHDHNFQPLSEERWSYNGLRILQNGDQLTIYSKNDPAKTVWSGTISLLDYPPFTLSIFGMWVHSEPIHMLSSRQLKLKEELIENLTVSCNKFWNAQSVKARTREEEKILAHRMTFLSGNIKKLMTKLTESGEKKRNKWAKWFFEEYPAKLIKARPQE